MTLQELVIQIRKASEMELPPVLAILTARREPTPLFCGLTEHEFAQIVANEILAKRKAPKRKSLNA